MEKKYKEAPLKLWQRAKELRMDVYRDVAEAKSKGRLLIAGGTESLIAVATGFDHAYLGGEPYGASIAAMGKENPALYQQILEACDHAGYPRDLCSYMRNYIGSVLLDKYIFGGPFPKADLLLQAGICDTHWKWYQIISEIKGIPYFTIDFIPWHWDEEGESDKARQLKVDYVTNQILEAIEWMIKTTGRNFDDEKFIQGCKNEFDSTSLWAKICELNTNIPAPLDEKTMFSLYILAVLARPKIEVVEYYRELLAEMQERVNNQIAANPYERFRVLCDSQPPWFGLDIYRVLERYGVVSVGAHYTFGLSGGWEYDKEKDIWNPGKTPQERDVPLKTRENAARALAEWTLKTGPLARCCRFGGVGKNKRILGLVKKWRADGVIMHLNRGCEGTAAGQVEVAAALLKEGIPTLTYEGNHADAREYDEGRTIARLESFMETLGLEKIY